MKGIIVTFGDTEEVLEVQGEAPEKFHVVV